MKGIYGLNEPDLPQRPKRPWKLRTKIALGFAALLGVSFLTLSFLGSNSPEMRDTIQKYISDSTGYPVSIGKLNAVSFYPLIGLDMDNVLLQREKESVAAKIGHFNLSTPFWGMTTASSVRTLDIRNVLVQPGVLFPGRLEIGRLHIDAADINKPKLVLNGAYGGQPVNASVNLERHIGWLRGVTYGVAEPAAFTISAGGTSIDGHIIDGSGGRNFSFEDVTVNGRTFPFRADVAFGVTDGGLHFKGRLMPGRSALSFDLESRDNKGVRAISGKIESDNLDISDLKGASSPFAIIIALNRFYQADQPQTRTGFDFNNLKLGIDLNLSNLTQGRIKLGDISAKLTTADNALHVDPLSGNLLDGVLKGQITLDAGQHPAALVSDVTLSQADYAALTPLVAAGDGKADAGRADVRVALKATGDDLDTLSASLNGKATVVAGSGSLTSSLVNLWGGGLLNAMLPGLEKNNNSLRLNCGIGDFIVDRGVAKSKTFFLDTDRVRIVGDGTVDLRRSTVDMLLNPKSKDTAFLSAATAVRVRGPIAKPSISPDAFSLGEKLGELFLGTINPVYLAFSMTDLGLKNDNPCRAYIKP